MMLALERSLGVVADLALFADHADRKRVYYIPTRPRIAKVDGRQELSFVRFRRADATEGGIGLLSFTAELTPTQAQLDKAKQHAISQGVAEPVLAQVPWIGGKAVFAAALHEGDGFVEKLLGEVKPDLAGGNRALFSVKLTEEGARLVEGLLELEGTSPLGVRYELEYAGLRPALAVRIRADYNRIYSELSAGFQFGIAYEGIGVRASVETATQKLRESGAIQVEVTHFTDQADLQSKVDEAVRWFQDRVLEDMFKTSLQPAAHEDLLSKALEAVKGLGAASLQQALDDETMASKLAEALGVSPEVLKGLGQAFGAGGGAGGGSGSAGGPGLGGAAASQTMIALKLQFTFRDIRQEELKTLTLDWTQAQAERRTAAPQGLFSRLGVKPDIVEAEDSGTFWDKLDVVVRPLGDFEALGVQGMVVQLAYPDENAAQLQPPMTFAPGQTDPKRFAAWTNGRPPRYRGRVEVRFQEDGPWPGPPVFRGAWQTLESLDLAVHPLSEVPRIELELAPGTLSFADTPQVQVDLRLDGRIQGTHMLTEAKPTAVFRRRLDPAPVGGMPPRAGTPPNGAAPLDGEGSGAAGSRLEARTTWFFPGGKRVEGVWAAVEGTTLLIHSPWRSTRTLRLMPLLPPDVLEALVTLTLAEPTRVTTTELRFEAGERRAKTVSIPTLAEQPPPVQIDTLVIRGDGSTFVAQPVTTTDPVAVIRDRDGVHRQVGVRLLAGATLAGHGLMAVQLQLLDENDETVDSVLFTESQREPGLLLVPGEAGARPRYRVVRYALDGAARMSEPREVTGTEVLVPAVVQA